MNSELVAGKGGVFEISVDDKLVFSKRSLDRFPDDGEVVKLIRGD
jgi:selT/selW/selH-like putative selenoprotein